jgi:hypothetical protein
VDPRPRCRTRSWVRRPAARSRSARHLSRVPAHRVSVSRPSATAGDDQPVGRRQRPSGQRHAITVLCGSDQAVGVPSTHGRRDANPRSHIGAVRSLEFAHDHLAQWEALDKPSRSAAGSAAVIEHGHTSSPRARGVSRRMDEAEWRAFVMSGTRTAKIATTRKGRTAAWIVGRSRANRRPINRGAGVLVRVAPRSVLAISYAD